MNSRSASNPGLFREEALASLGSDPAPEASLRVTPPWTWSLFWTLAVMMALAAAMTFCYRVEILRPGRGALRCTGGVRSLQAEVAGTVAQVHAANGDRLQAGDPVVRLQVAQVQSDLLLAERQLSLWRSLGGRQRSVEQELALEQMAALRARRLHQESQVRSFEESVRIQQGKLESVRLLHQAGLVSAMEVETARDAVCAITRQHDSAQQQVHQLNQDLAAMESGHRRQGFNDAQIIQGTLAKREALDVALRQTGIRAPAGGYLEALAAKPGDLLQAGQVVARLVPEDAPIGAIAFLEEKDRAGVKVGDRVRLALEAYPVAEYGTLEGRVCRIGADPASRHEVKEALGETGRLEVPTYRVELELLPGRSRRLRTLPLRPGMQLQARFVVRRERIVTLVFAPLRRWLS